MTRKQYYLSMCTALVTWIAASTSLYSQSPADQFSEAAGYYSRGEWTDSVSAFETLIGNHPKTEQSNEGYFFLGESQLQLSNFPLAKIAYQKFLVYQPHSEFVPRASFRLAEIAYRTQDVQATAMLETFIRENPNSELLQFAAAYLGEARLQKNEPKLAQHVFEKVLSQFPNSTMIDEYRLGLGKSLQMQFRHGEARTYFDQLIQQGGPKIIGETRLQLGLLEFAQSNWAEAIEYFSEVKRNTVNTPARITEATYWLGRCHLELGEPQKAIQYFEDLSPEQVSAKLGPAVYFDGAVAWTHAGRTEEAIKWLTQIRENFSDSEWGDDALQLEIEIAQRLSDHDKVLELVERFETKYRQSPLYVDVKESEGRIHYDRREYKKTVEIFSELLSQPAHDTPESQRQRATWNYFVGLGQIGLKDFDSAVATLSQTKVPADDLSFKAAVAIAHGTALSAIGDYETATQRYRTYLSLQPNGAEVARCLSELAISEAELKNWTNAATAFDQLKQDFENEQYVVTTAVFLASSAYQDKQLGLAARWYEILIQPGMEKELVGKGLTGLAWVYLKGGDNRRALEHFERILAEFPDTDFAIDAAMARAKQLEDAKNYDEASKTYQLVVSRTSQVRLANIARLRVAYCSQKLGGPNHLNAAKVALTDYLQSPTNQDQIDEAIYQLAWVYNDLKLPEQGYRQFEKLAQNHADSKYWADAAYRLAEYRFKSKDYEKTQELINQLLTSTTQPEILSRSIYMNGQMAAMRNEWANVSRDMRSLIDRCDDKGIYAKASYWLAESLYQQNEIVAAADLFGQLVEKTDLLDQTVWPWVALRHSQCQAKIDQWPVVLAASEKAIASFPEFKLNFEHVYLMGRSLEKLGRLDEAREKFQSVVASPKGGRTETAAKAQWRIGETFFHQEDYKKAIRAFYKVDSLFTYPRWRSAAIYEAGKCQEHLGNWTHAVILYEQLLRDFPECEFADKAKKRLQFSNRQASAVATEVNR